MKSIKLAVEEIFREQQEQAEAARREAAAAANPDEAAAKQSSVLVETAPPEAETAVQVPAQIPVQAPVHTEVEPAPKHHLPPPESSAPAAQPQNHSDAHIDVRLPKKLPVREQKNPEEVAEALERIAQELWHRQTHQLQQQPDEASIAAWQKLRATDQRAIEETENLAATPGQAAQQSAGADQFPSRWELKTISEGPDTVQPSASAPPARRKFIVAAAVAAVAILAIVGGRVMLRGHEASPPSPTTPAAPTVGSPDASANGQAQPSAPAVIEVRDTKPTADPAGARRAPTAAAQSPSPKPRAEAIASKLSGPLAAPPKVASRANAPVAAPAVVGGVPSFAEAGQPGSGTNGLISSRAPALAPPSEVPVGGQLTQARLLSSVPPVYPVAAKQVGVQGDVEVQADIDTAGKVTRVKIISGNALLHQAAMEAVRRWKYEPATLNGKPVPVQVMVTIRFRLAGR